MLEKTLDSFDSKDTNQSTLKGINPEYSLERLMLKLTLERLRAGGEGGERGCGGWMASLI